MRVLAVLLFCFCLSSAPKAQEQASAEPENTPILQLDTGGHMALVKGLIFTPDGKFIISAGDDKVIRVWDWRAGKTVRTIRGQSGPGNEGKIYALALSPDGRWLAAGGAAPEHAIRLYGFASGELKALLKGHTFIVNALAFSPDGKKLISGSGAGDLSAIIWDVERGTALRRLEGHSAEIYGVGFTPDGERAVTGSLDKTLRLWRVADGALIKEMTGHGSIVRSLAISPAGGGIASSSRDGEIRLWEGKTGAFIKVLARLPKQPGALRFSPDGRALLATCSRDCAKRQEGGYVYDTTTGKLLTSYAKHEEIAVASAFSPDGGVVATAGGQEILVWDPQTGETKAVLKGTGRQSFAVGFSADGASIAWGGGAGRDPMNRGALEAELKLPRSGEPLSAPRAANAAASWVRTQKTSGAVTLRHRKGGEYGFDEAILDLLKDGRPGVSIERSAKDGYAHRAYGFTPDGKQIVSGGGNGWLFAYGLDGAKLGGFLGHQSDIWAISASPDGRYLVSGSADQTVRLWNLQTRELIVTVFRGMDGEWVAWTPQGYYAGSPGSDRILGWQINRGADKAADYVTGEQLRKRLNRPDIVAKAIQLGSAEEATRVSHGTKFRLADLLARPAPSLRILAPAADGAAGPAGAIPLKIALGATPDPVTRIRIQVNGRQLGDFLPGNGPKFEAGEHKFDVPLAKGKNTIVITALNEIGWSKALDGTVTLAGAGEGGLDKRGALYLIAIGVSKYPGIAGLCSPKPSCDLDYSSADAIAFADTMEAKLGALHERTVRRVLVSEGRSDGAPTAANIVDALGILRQATANDTVAVFLSGHGFNDGPNYRFAPTDAAFAGGMIRPSSVVPWYAIEEAIDSASGRRLLFIDTCHSAGAYNERLGNAAYYANILAYSAARWDQVAWESSEAGHGFFTKAIVEGMAGKADAAKTGRVDTVQLNSYLQARVRELAKALGQEQDPQFFRGRDAEDYTLAVLRN